MTIGSLTTFGANAVLDGTSLPATLYAAFHTADPGSSGTGSPATDTQRLPITRAAAVAEPTISIAAASPTIDNCLSDPWSSGQSFTHMVLHDAATGGNPWWVVPLTTTLDVATGEAITVSACDVALEYWQTSPLFDAIMALSPIGYWKLDESSGTVATDYSGNGHHGTYSGTHTLQGQTGGDGVGYADFRGGLVTIPDAPAFSANFASGLTWGCFIRPEAAQLGVATARIFIAKGAASNYEWVSGFSDGAAGRVRCNFFNSAGSTITGEQIDGTLAANTWELHMVASASPVFGQRFDVYGNSSTPLATSATGGLNNAYAAGNAAVYLGGRADLGAGNRMVGGMAHAFVMAGKKTSLQLATIRAAAQAEGWSV